MRRLLLAGLALLAIACGSDAAGSDVASLTEDTALELATTEQEPDVDQEEAMLAFAACMRDEGIDMDDPEVDSEGNVSLALGATARDAGIPREDIQAAFETCGELIEGVTQQFQRVDQTELEDQLLAFSECMRDEGIDMPDPDLSGIGPGSGGGGPFGDLDIDDPAFQAASEVCQDELPNFGGGPGRGATATGRGGDGNG